MSPSYIIIHHSLTDDNKHVSWGAIRKYHKGLVEGSPYKMNDIGYHFGLELVDDQIEVLLGRLPYSIGAHTKELSMNTKSIGVCCIGNFDKYEPSSRMVDKLVWLLNYLRHEFAIPVNQILGHREVGMMAGFDWTKGQYKTCPGKLFDMDMIRMKLT